MKVVLQAIQGPDHGASVELDQEGSLVFGRDAPSNVRFEKDPHMSRRHFEVTLTADEARVVDLGSANGLFINEQRLTDAVLAHGDKLCAGQTLFAIEIVRDQDVELIAESLHQEAPSPALAEEAYPTIDGGADRSGAPDHFVEQSPRVEQPAKAEQVPQLRPMSSDKKSDNPFGSMIFGFDEASEPVVSGPGAAPFGEMPVGEERAPDVQLGLRDRPSGSLHGEQLGLFQVDTERKAADGFYSLLGMLSHKYMIQLVTHPKKVRCEPPADGDQFVSVFDWAKRAWSPVMCSYEALGLDSIKDLMGRLCLNDACVAFLGQNQAALARRVLEMQHSEFAGFSEAGGMLGCYWPSSLATMIDCGGVNAITHLFQEDVEALLMCTPGQDRAITCVGRQDLLDKLISRDYAASRVSRVT